MHHVRVHLPRTDRIHENVVWCELRCQALHETDHPELGGGIRAVLDSTANAEQRGCEDDAAALALIDQMATEHLTGQERAGQVHVQQPLPAIEWRIQNV